MCVCLFSCFDRPKRGWSDPLNLGQYLEIAIREIHVAHPLPHFALVIGIPEKGSLHSLPMNRRVNDVIVLPKFRLEEGKSRGRGGSGGTRGGRGNEGRGMRWSEMKRAWFGYTVHQTHVLCEEEGIEPSGGAVWDAQRNAEYAYRYLCYRQGRNGRDRARTVHRTHITHNTYAHTTHTQTQAQDTHTE